jgi:hypothetical protein
MDRKAAITRPILSQTHINEGMGAKRAKGCDCLVVAVRGGEGEEE